MNTDTPRPEAGLTLPLARLLDDQSQWVPD